MKSIGPIGPICPYSDSTIHDLRYTVPYVTTLLRSVPQSRSDCCRPKPSTPLPVSSIDSPPKKRNSTTRLRRGSISARLARASSKATRSGLRLSVTSAASLSVTSNHPATAFLVLATPRVVNQDTPHQLGSNRQEMRPVLPSHVFLIHQVHVRLIN